MNSIVQVRRTRRPVAVVALTLLSLVTVIPAAAQNGSGKKVLNIDDYSRWKSVEGSRISGDGNWVVYEMRPTNTAEAKPTLHILQLGSNRDQEVTNASGATFSDDSRWVAYSIEPAATGGRGGRGGAAGGGAAPANPPAQGGRAGGQANQPRKVELRNLESGAVKTWEDIQSFTFNSGSTHLLLRRRQTAQNAQYRGADAVLHELATGRDQLLGSVNESSFNKNGDLLAYTVDAAVKDANGLTVIDLKTGRVESLDSDARNYSRLTWHDSGTALAVLKAKEVEKQRERENMLVVFPNIRSAIEDSQRNRVTLDAGSVPNGFVISERGTLSWSDDGKRVFFGIKEQREMADTAALRRGTEFVADVDVWRTTDERVQSMQMVRAEADRGFTYTQAFDLSSGKFIALADSTMRELEIGQDGRWAVGRDPRQFISDYGRARADVYRVNTSTGERTLMFKGMNLGNFVYGISPDGGYYLFWRDNQVHAYDLNRGTSHLITKGSPVSFVDMEEDHFGPRPSYGIAGYTKDGKSVILSHRYDLWQFPLDGSGGGKNITNGLGTKGDIRFAYVRTEPEPAGGGGRGGRGGGGGTIDLSKPVLLSAYGQWTKKAGFYELRDGQMRELVYADAIFSPPAKAAKADKYLFTRQTFTEFPDLQVSGLAFTDAKKITDANPQHSEYSWGRRILFEYKNKKGVRLQGTLAIPDTYKPGDKLPMLVNFYEKNSQNLHRYLSPNYLTGMGSLPVEALTKGYLLMQPDVHFNTRTSHSDMLESVEAAVRKVIELGYVDPKRIGVNGHSYGGQGAAFVGTRSRLFAAIGMGAGVTDLTTDFSQPWGWAYGQPGGSGATGFDYYINGQGRQGTNPWDDPELFRFESARTHVREATAPFLIMHGTADPTVAFHEGLGFYNALRFNKKEATLLAYPGEGHGLRGMANRRDLTIRYMQFFDHYLKGEPAPRWLSEGVPFLDKDYRRDPAKDLPAKPVTTTTTSSRRN